MELFRRLDGDQAADAAGRGCAENAEESAAAFVRVCYPPAKPGYVEEAARRTRLGIRTREVNLHHWRSEEPHPDP